MLTKDDMLVALHDPNLVRQIQTLVGELKKDKTLDSQVRSMIEDLTW